MIKRQDRVGCILLFMYFSFILSILALNAVWTDRSMDFWLLYVKGSGDFPLWLSSIVSLVPFSVIFNIISEVARFFI